MGIQEAAKRLQDAIQQERDRIAKEESERECAEASARKAGFERGVKWSIDDESNGKDLKLFNDYREDDRAAVRKAAYEQLRLVAVTAIGGDCGEFTQHALRSHFVDGFIEGVFDTVVKLRAMLGLPASS